MAKKKVSSMSSNGPPSNYCGAPEVNLKTCAKRTKWRVYTFILSLNASPKNACEKIIKSNDIYIALVEIE